MNTQAVHNAPTGPSQFAWRDGHERFALHPQLSRNRALGVSRLPSSCVDYVCLERPHRRERQFLQPARTLFLTYPDLQTYLEIRDNPYPLGTDHPYALCEALYDVKSHMHVYVEAFGP